MTPDQVSAWAASGESETLELKRTTGERREAARTLCAMLNHRGGRVMAELALSAGLPRPEIEDAGGCVTVRFRPTRYIPPQRVAKDLTERQRRVLAHLAGSPGGAAVRDIAAALGVSDSPWVIREDLAALKNLDLVRSSGWGRGARWALAGP